jgi:hypothetical protein
MSKINVTITANSAVQLRTSLATPQAIGRTAGAFFLNFASDTVEQILTDLKSIICSMAPHSITNPVRLCHREISHN